jgi:hypothetical protein
MLTRNRLVDEWRGLLAKGPSQHRELDPDIPIRMIYGSDEQGRPILFSITERQPPLPASAGAIEIERLRRESDGRWTLSLILDELRFFDVFVDLCLDLGRRGSVATNEALALKAVAAGIEQWRGLFSGPPVEHLSEEAVRGIVAELWFGFEHLRRGGLSAEQMVLSWRGPAGAPKDYLLPDGTAFEVKSIHADSRYVSISSAEQLDDATGPTTLVTVGLEPVHGDGLTLLQLHADINTAIAGDPNALREFRRRFVDLGVDPTDDYYAGFSYVVVSHRHYRVDAGFPAIKRSTIDDRITEVEYRLRISGLQDFLMLDASAADT